MTFGSYLRARRVEAHMSLRRLAKELGVSAVYLGEVERGVRGPLARERWDRLVALLPTLSLQALGRYAAEEKPLQLDLTDAPPQYQDLTHALARRIERRDLSETEISELMSLLGESWGDRD